MAWSIEALIASRALQGMVACAQSVVVMAVIRDLFEETRAVRIWAAYGMALSVTPAIAPSIGGFIFLLAGWRANFLLLAIITALVFELLWRFLPETGKPDPDALRPGRIVLGYLALLSNGRYLVQLAVVAATMFGLFAYITAAPFVMVDLEGVAIHHYGLYQAAAVSFYFLGNAAAGRTVSRLGVERILSAGLIIQCVGGLALLGLVLAELHSPVNLTIGMAIYAFGMAFVFTTNPVLALRFAARGTGQAAALYGCFSMLGGALGGVYVGVADDGTAGPLGTAMAIAGVCGFASFLAVRAITSTIAPPARS